MSQNLAVENNHALEIKMDKFVKSVTTLENQEKNKRQKPLAGDQLEIDNSLTNN